MNFATVKLFSWNGNSFDVNAEAINQTTILFFINVTWLKEPLCNIRLCYFRDSLSSFKDLSYNETVGNHENHACIVPSDLKSWTRDYYHPQW